MILCVTIHWCFILIRSYDLRTDYDERYVEYINLYNIGYIKYNECMLWNIFDINISVNIYDITPSNSYRFTGASMNFISKLSFRDSSAIIHLSILVYNDCWNCRVRLIRFVYTFLKSLSTSSHDVQINHFNDACYC